jgi:hypothetical protein
MKPALEYIHSSPEPYRSILLDLQLIIESAFIDVELLYKWKLPFYYRNSRMFCFLNYSKTYVDLGIPDGILLNDPYKELIAGESRKRLRPLRFYTVEDINQQQIRKFLNQLSAIKNS